MKTAAPYAFSFMALAIFVAYIYPRVDEYRQLLTYEPQLIALIVILVLLPDKGLLNYVMYRGLNVKLSINESIGLGAVNTLANQLPFAGGMMAKGVYLKQRHKLSYGSFLGSTAALYVVSLATTGILGLIVLFFVGQARNGEFPYVIAAAFGAMILAGLFMVWPKKLPTYSGRFSSKISQLLEGRRLFSQNWRTSTLLIGIQLIGTLLFAGRLWASYHMLSQDVTLGQCVLFSCATLLTRLVSIAPGGLGVREAIVAAVASLLAIDPGVSVLAVTIDRLISTLVIAVLGLAYTYILSKKITDDQAYANQ